MSAANKSGKRDAAPRGGITYPRGPAEARPVTGAPASFKAVWDRAGGVEGWLKPEQGWRLFDAARTLGPDATVVEVGSFRGRSTIVLALAAPDDAEVIAIDPHGGGDRGPGEIAPDAARGDADHAAFTENLAAAGVAHRVTHVRKLSAHASNDVDGAVDLLFVDGAHRFGPARSDIVQWGDRVGDGGTMLVHDAFSSVGVTLALLSTTAVSTRWRYVDRIGSLATYRRVHLAPRDRLADAARQAAQMPWFVRNLAIKCLIVARLGPLTRLLGHRGGWPY